MELNSENFNDALWKQQIFTPAEHASLDYPIASMESDAENKLEHNVVPTAYPEWPKRRGEVVSSYYLNHVVREQGFDWTKNLKNYSHKVLFLRGNLNELMPLSHQQELASYYPNHEIITIEEAGHDVLNLKFNNCIEIVCTYLKEID